jgi:hypothetical protein
MVGAAWHIKDFNDHELLRPFVPIAENGTTLRSVTSPVLQLTIAFFEVKDQFTLQILQVSDFAPNLGKLGTQQIPDFPAGMSTLIAQAEKLFDFPQ